MGSKIVLFGKPGVGKGTRLSQFLEGRENEFRVISTGNLIRKEISEKTELGLKFKSYSDVGLLVPDEIINQIVINAINSSGSDDIFLDGFPRTTAQAYALLDADIYPDMVIEFFVDDEVVLQRARDRIVCKDCGEPYTTNDFKRPKKDGVCDKCDGKLIKRDDDKEEVVKERLEVYRNETYPVLDVFKEAGIKIYTIDNIQKDSLQKFKDILENQLK